MASTATLDGNRSPSDEASPAPYRPPTAVETLHANNIDVLHQVDVTNKNFIDTVKESTGESLSTDTLDALTYQSEASRYEIATLVNENERVVAKEVENMCQEIRSLKASLKEAQEHTEMITYPQSPTSPGLKASETSSAGTVVGNGTHTHDDVPPSGTVTKVCVGVGICSAHADTVKTDDGAASTPNEEDPVSSDRNKDSVVSSTGESSLIAPGAGGEGMISMLMNKGAKGWRTLTLKSRVPNLALALLVLISAILILGLGSAYGPHQEICPSSYAQGHRDAWDAAHKFYKTA